MVRARRTDPPKVIEQNETGHGIGPSAWTPVGEPQTVRAKQEAILAIQNQMFVQRLINVGIAAGMIVAVILGGIELASQGNESSASSGIPVMARSRSFYGVRTGVDDG